MHLEHHAVAPSPVRTARSLALVWVLLAEAPLSATLTWAVNSADDAQDAVLDGICETAPGNGVCTLRAAISEANYLGQWTDTRITIPGMALQISLGELEVQTVYPMVIEGAGASVTIVRRQLGAPPQRFLRLTSGSLELRSLQVTGFDGDYGGAIESFGQLRIDHCLFLANVATQVGGAVKALNELLEIVASRFVGNQAPNGGAIAANAELRIRDSIFESNSSTYGGAIESAWPGGTITGSHFRANSAVEGGALFVGFASELAVVNSTFADNSALGNGGAVAIVRQPDLPTRLALFNSTLTGNRADADLDGVGEGGAVYFNYTSGPGGAVTASNSILAGNFGSITIQPWGNRLVWPQECYGLFASNGYNIVRANDEGLCSISGAVSTADPALEPLAWNGGFAATRAITPASPAWGAGRPQAAGGCVDEVGLPLTVDQRGAARPSAGNCDLGAFEHGPMIFTDDFELGLALRWSASAP